MPDFGAGVLGGLGIETVEEVAAGRIGVNMEGEILAGGLQGVGEVLDFTESYVVVACVCLDEQGGAQLLDIGCWRAAAILLGRFGDGLAQMIGSGEELLVVLAPDAAALFKSAEGRAGGAGGLITRGPNGGAQGIAPAVT